MMDVALLFDSSGSVQRENFPRLVQFAQSVVNDLYVSLEDTRVAAITFGTEAQVRGLIVNIASYSFLLIPNVNLYSVIL